jgi:hypothetical protein
MTTFSGRHRWLIATTVMLIAIFATVLLLEIAARLYSALAFPKMMENDPALGWKHRANVARRFTNEHGEAVLVTQNALGFRGALYPEARASGRFRVLFLGDSFTEGTQVSDAALFTAVIERMRPEIEAINAGTASYGTLQELLLWREIGARVNPDAVVVMFYSNDLTDNELAYSPAIGPRPYARLDDGALLIVTAPDPGEFRKFLPPVPGAAFLNDHSLVFNYFNSRVYQRLRAARLLAIARADLDVIEARGQSIAIFFALLEQLRHELEFRDIPLGVVLIPAAWEVEQQQSRLHQRMLAECAVRNLRCESLLAPMVASAAGGATPYFSADIHWTTDGHAAAAQFLVPFVSGLRQRDANATAAPAPR